MSRDISSSTNSGGSSGSAPLKYRGRIGQASLYFGKLLRMFIYQNDWKVLPMSAAIAAVVTYVVGENLFVTQEGTLTGSFALVCVCIWNGFFNSIQCVCREREIVKREHRAGLHMSSYIAAHMLYQLLLCIAQTGVTLGICLITGVHFPAQGTVTSSGFWDIGITLLIATYTADMMALMISCVVHNTTTAMTVMPFMLLFQLVFSGGYFSLTGFAEKITVLSVSRWGMDSICSVGRYNEQPMVTLWNTLFKFRNVEYMGRKPLLELIVKVEQENRVNDFLLWSGTYNQSEKYVSTASRVLQNWGAMALLALAFVVISVIALEFIDRDKR